MPTTWLYTPLTMMLETFSELFNLLAKVSMVFSGGLGSQYRMLSLSWFGSRENTPIHRSVYLLTVVSSLWCPILGTLGLCLMGNYNGGHTCATSSRNVSRELTIHGGGIMGAHPDVMLILYKCLICSVLEYGCIAFDRMAGTHMLKLERV
jgi:hypothetical protein